MASAIIIQITILIAIHQEILIFSDSRICPKQCQFGCEIAVNMRRYDYNCSSKESGSPCIQPENFGTTQKVNFIHLIS